MSKFLTSLRTTLALLAALVLLAAFGSFAIQLDPQAYGRIEESVLLEWLRSEGLSGASWWVLAMIVAAALLCANGLACVAVSLVRSRRRRSLPWRTVWAHAAHLAFLLVLGGHLIGSVWGFRSDGHPAFSGQSFGIPQKPGWTVTVQKVSVEFAPEGYPRSVEAPLKVWSGGRLLAEGTARVNHPVFVEGAAVYLRDARPTLRGWAVQGSAETRVAEFGAPLRLAGGSLLLREWAQSPDGRLAVRLVWFPDGAAPREAWLAPVPGNPLSLPAGPALRWGEMAVDAVGTFDVRYDPGARLALWGGLLLSVSLVPLLRPRKRSGTQIPQASCLS